MGTLKLSKLDSAKRQLETPIVLYFHNRDPVSAHTLTAAAHGILEDLDRTAGGAGMIITGKLLEYVKPEYVEIFRKRLRDRQNFFKHADRDPEGILSFDPGLTDHLLLDACFKYQELTSEVVPLLQLFISWFMMHHREMFSLPDEIAQAQDQLAKLFKNAERNQYFTECLPLVTQLPQTSKV